MGAMLFFMPEAQGLQPAFLVFRGLVKNSAFVAFFIALHIAEFFSGY